MYRSNRKIIASLLVLIAAVVAFGGCASTNNPAPAPAAAASKEEPVSLNGVWKDDIFVATIEDDLIVINIVDGETRSLYWRGTFPVGSDKVTSVGDREALDSALMGSQDAEKVFAVRGDEISFDFSMMGTTKTVHLKR